MNLEGANSGGLGDGSPPEDDDFSQLKGYLDVTSVILGGALKSASVVVHIPHIYCILKGNFTFFLQITRNFNIVEICFILRVCLEAASMRSESRRLASAEICNASVSSRYQGDSASSTLHILDAVPTTK